MYIRKGFEEVTLKQLELMAHAIGFERKKIKYNKFKMHRNYFSTHTNAKNYPDLESLVAVGLMEKRSDPFNEDGLVYHVTAWGKELFGSMFSCSLVKID